MSVPTEPSDSLKLTAILSLLTLERLSPEILSAETRETIAPVSD